jgi:hypothetical protein
MSDKNEPKDHHYVPAFYLKKWTRAEVSGKLIEFKRVHQGQVVSKECSERATGYQRFLYSKPTENLTILDHSLESGFLAPLDQKGSNLLNLLLSGSQKLTLEQRDLWAKFIALLMVRSPDEMKVSEEGYGTLLAVAAKEDEEWYQGVRSEECPETFWGFIKGLPEYDIKGMHRDSFIKFSEGEKFIPFLRDLKWTIRKLRNSKLPLLTSDRPVFCNNRLGFPDGLLFMPLNPEIIFFAQPLSARLHPILSCGSDNQVMRFCNEKIVGQANQYV